MSPVFSFCFRSGRQEFRLNPQDIVEIIIPNHEHRHRCDYDNAFLAEAVQQALQQIVRYVFIKVTFIAYQVNRFIRCDMTRFFSIKIRKIVLPDCCDYSNAPR